MSLLSKTKMNFKSEEREKDWERKEPANNRDYNLCPLTYVWMFYTK